VSEVWRTFCAVELPEEVRERFQDHIRHLREAIPDVAASWSRVANSHLTLKFFGNVATDRLPAISAAATRGAKEFSLIEIAISGAGVFPRPSRAQVLWIGVSDPSGKLSALQQRFEDECALETFAKDERAYRPHLTIARIRKTEGARRLAEAHLQLDFQPASIKLREFVIFRSQLSSKGSKYTAISRHQLSDP
jgi:2'-5' RNA ligase